MIIYFRVFSYCTYPVNIIVKEIFRTEEYKSFLRKDEPVLKIVTSRDIKNNPNILFEEGAETVITSRGRPKAVCIALDEEDSDHIEDLLSSLRIVRTKISLEKLRTEASNSLDPDEDNEVFEEKINIIFDRDSQQDSVL